MNTVFILLGANLGEPKQQFSRAAASIQAEIGSITQSSSHYESAAWGVTDQPPFINQVLIVETTLGAPEILTCCLAIEERLGRVRHEKWGARVIDIDLLYFNQEIIDLPNLQIPHPYIQERRFTLMPLAEIAPTYIHPILQQSNTALLAACGDPLYVKKQEISYEL